MSGRAGSPAAPLRSSPAAGRVYAPLLLRYMERSASGGCRGSNATHATSPGPRHAGDQGCPISHPAAHQSGHQPNAAQPLEWSCMGHGRQDQPGDHRAHQTGSSQGACQRQQLGARPAAAARQARAAGGWRLRWRSSRAAGGCLRLRAALHHRWVADMRACVWGGGELASGGARPAGRRIAAHAMSARDSRSPGRAGARLGAPALPAATDRLPMTVSVASGACAGTQAAPARCRVPRQRRRSCSSVSGRQGGWQARTIGGRHAAAARLGAGSRAAAAVRSGRSRPSLDVPGWRKHSVTTPGMRKTPGAKTRFWRWGSCPRGWATQAGSHALRSPVPSHLSASLQPRHAHAQPAHLPAPGRFCPLPRRRVLAVPALRSQGV